MVGTLERQRDEALSSLPQVQRETTAEYIRNQVEQTDRIVEELEDLRRELAMLSQRLAA